MKRARDALILEDKTSCEVADPVGRDRVLSVISPGGATQFIVYIYICMNIYVYWRHIHVAPRQTPPAQTGTKDLDVRHSGVDFKPFCPVHGHGLRMFAFIAFLGGLVFLLDYEKKC